MKFFITSSSSLWLLLVLATPSVIAKKGKKTKTTKNNNNIGPGVGGGPDLNCDPARFNGCYDNDCAMTNYEDGCEKCMCYNQGNDSWCDETISSFYDDYYKEHGENPFGDSNRSNRKCNPNFSPLLGRCKWDWECEAGLKCDNNPSDSLSRFRCLLFRNGRDFDCDPMKGSSYDGCFDDDCASTNWEDGCEACMCYNQGNDSWCDGTKSSYYDNYYKENGKNPFGDSNRKNRKCNTNFLPEQGRCKWNWECEGGQECTYQNNDWRCR